MKLSQYPFSHGLQAKLEADAVDMGAGGKDNIYGSGRLQLGLTPSDPLRGYWQFNGSGTEATDSSGSENHGTIVGATRQPTGSADGSEALSFDGVDDYVSVPDSASLDVTSGITVEAWVKLDAVGRNYIVDKRTVGTNWGMKFGDNQQRIEAFVGNGTGVCIARGVGTVPLGEWTHVAFTYDAATGALKLYINGVLDEQAACTTGPIATNGGVLRIGDAFGVDLVEEITIL